MVNLNFLTARTNTGGLRGRKLRWAISFTATMAFSLFGYDQGLMSGIISADQFVTYFPPADGDSVIQGAITSCYELGCFFGALFALFYGDKTGRRPLVVCGSVIIVIGTIISVTAIKPYWQTGQFVIGRVITGLGNGLNTATVPIWQSEISRAENRGKLVNMEGAVVAIGTFIAYWIDFGLSYVNNSASWRVPVAIQIVFAAVLFIGILELPESPRWLVAHDRKPEAYEVLAALNDCAPDDDQVIAEASVIVDAVNRFSKLQTGFSDLFTHGKTQHFQRMVIGSSTQFFQQFTGCNAAIYYSTVLFHQTIFNGTKYRLSLILGGVFATVYALATIPSFFLIDTLGRRNLFLIGATGQGCAFLISFACLVHSTEENAKGAAVGIFLFIVFFAFTILPLPWIYPPEINPLRTRTAAAAVSTCTNWLCNFAVVMFTPVFIAKSDWGCYLFFACINFLWVPIIFFYYVETAGRSLEEIDVIFAKAHVEKRQPWRVAATLPKLSLQDIEDQSKELGLYEEDFEKDNFETKEDISDSSSNPHNGVFEKPEETEANNRPTDV